MLLNNILEFNELGEPIANEAAIYLIKQFKEVEGWASSKTKSVAFSLDDMREIIRQVEFVNGNGVRIYFGKYPETDVPNLTLPKPSYKGRATVVFIPTVDNQSGGYLNYFEVEREVIKPTFPSIPTKVGNAYNHGQLEP